MHTTATWGNFSSLKLFARFTAYVLLPLTQGNREKLASGRVEADSGNAGPHH